MKKIIRGIVLGIVAAIVITIGGLAAYMFIPRKDADVKPTVTDVSGNAYRVFEDKSNDKKYAVVTDNQGKIWGAEINDDGSVGETKENLEGKVSKEDVIQNYSGPSINVTNDISQFTGSVSEVSTQATTNNAASTTTTTTENGGNTAVTTTAPNEKEELKITKYKEIFASNNYLIVFTTNDETLGNKPITAAAKNGNIIIDTSIENITCKMLYLASKDKMYLLLDSYRMYCSVPQSLLGDDFDMSDMNMGSNLAGGIDVDKIKKSTVTIDGVNYYCESCKTKDGGEVRYYFNGDSLVRFDSDTVENGVVKTNSTFFSKITTEVPDDTFEIPSNYKYLNVGWLDSLTGGKK